MDCFHGASLLFYEHLLSFLFFLFLFLFFLSPSLFFLLFLGFCFFLFLFLFSFSSFFLSLSLSLSPSLTFSSFPLSLSLSLCLSSLSIYLSIYQSICARPCEIAAPGTKSAFEVVKAPRLGCQSAAPATQLKPSEDLARPCCLGETVRKTAVPCFGSSTFRIAEVFLLDFL